VLLASVPVSLWLPCVPLSHCTRHLAVPLSPHTLHRHALRHRMRHLTMPSSPYASRHHAPRRHTCHLTVLLSPYASCHCTRASVSSRHTTSGSRNPPADTVDNIEDVADRGVCGVHAVRSPASSGPPRRWVLITCPCSWSRFVRTAAAATLGGPPRPPAALGLPTSVCAQGRGRRGGGKGAMRGGGCNRQ